MRLFRRFVPSTDELDGQKLFTRVNGHRVATPLLAVLVVIEVSDLIFAIMGLRTSHLCRLQDVVCSLGPHADDRVARFYPFGDHRGDRRFRSPRPQALAFVAWQSPTMILNA